MQQDYSHLKLSALDIKEHEKIMVNALGFFRGNGKKKPRYPMPMLFQMAAFSERFFTLQVHHERATPPTQMTEEEVYDPVFAEKLDFFTQEFIDACQACLPVMDSVHSITPSVVSIAAALLNPLNSPPQYQIPLDSAAARAHVVGQALALSLQYSQVPWTREMSDKLLAWYPAAFLLCGPLNVPPDLPAEVRTALDWAMGLDEKPKRRFTSMHAQFNTMISPSPEAYERIELPSGMQP